MRTPTRRTRLPTHVSDSTTQVGQDHAATEVLLVLGTNNHLHLLENAAEQATRAATDTHRSDRSPAPVRPVKSTGQTGRAWAARDEQRPRVNSSKSNSRSPDSLHGFAQDFGDSRNTSWALHSQDLVHQNSLNQEESKDFH